jgi:hypothetical protein
VSPGSMGAQQAIQRGRVIALTVMLLLAAAVGPARGLAAWHQPVNAPLNAVAGTGAGAPSTTSVDAVPYVAWDETTDPGIHKVRVSRLEPDGSWHLVGGPLYADVTRSSVRPRIASVVGVPYVTWEETTATNFQVRVARLEGDGNWHLVGGPLYFDPTKEAASPSIAAVAGVPYVAWAEDTGTNHQIRVARLGSGDNWQLVDDALYADSTKDASVPSIADVGGVPYVAWTEAGSPNEVRVAKFQAGDGHWHLVGDALPAASANADTPSIAAVGGVPYVAWWEHQGLTYHARVGRLKDGDWELVSGALYSDPNGSADEPSIAALGSIPYVAFHEFDGTHSHVWVARLETNGLWHVVSHAVDAETTPEGTHPSLAVAGTTPYVAWQQADGGSIKLRAARLNPDFLSSRAVPTRTGAMLTARVRPYGLKFQIGFQFGTALERQTTTDRAEASGLDDVVTVNRTLTGLSPAKTYKFRPFSYDPERSYAGQLQPPALGPVGTFRPDGIPPSFLSAAIDPKRFAVGKKHGTRFRLKLSEAGQVVFTIARNRPGRKVGGKCVRQRASNAGKPKCTRHQRSGRFTRRLPKGKSTVGFSGRLGGKSLEAGHYRLRLVATDALGNSSAPRDLAFTIVPLP